jgi:hypothetical protein
MASRSIPPYSFRKGETIRLALDATTGDIGTVTAITASLKPALPNGELSDAGNVNCAIAAYPASGGNPAGWSISISAAQSANLAPGNYAIIALLTIGADIIATEPAPIRVRI